MKNIMLSIMMVVTCSMFNSAIAQENNVQPRRIALKFHADWCGSCKAMGRYLKTLPTNWMVSRCFFMSWTLLIIPLNISL